MTPARTYWLKNRNNTITASLARRFSKENGIQMMSNNLSQLSQKDKRDIIVCELEASHIKQAECYSVCLSLRIAMSLDKYN